MPTNIELKTQIDTNIINKVLPNSVTRSNIGNTNKSIIDYVDQQDNLKENILNKSVNIVTDSVSDIKYPSVKAVKTYVDSQTTLIYKKYVALLSQSGTNNPVVTTLLENTFTNPIVWTRTSPGLYVGTLTGAFTNLKTWCMICPISVGGTWSLYPINDNQVQLRTWDITSATNVDEYLNETSIEIRVYN